MNFDPEAHDATLDRYLATIEAQSTGMKAFLARCFGVALTGDAEAETLFLLQGDGGSGKTTMVEAVASMLGDYATKMNFESLCQSKHGRGPGAASPDLIPLRGARLAYASEGDSSARLDAGKVKELTGNEPTTARALYSAPMTFRPTWKVWLVSNFDPKVDSEDTGIWRRMAKLQFAVIPTESRDPAVKRVLTTNPGARSAVLSWALAGCLDWQKRGGGRAGLAPPKAVEDATAAYRVTQDTLAEWWEELMATANIGDNTKDTPKHTIRCNYQKWCETNGNHHPVSPQRLAAYLKSKGLSESRSAASRVWVGIQLEFPRSTGDSAPY